MNGTLIVLEGLDGSGKATQAQALCAHLEQQARPLLNRLQLSLKNLRFLVGADDPAANARQALEWIAAQRARLDRSAGD